MSTLRPSSLFTTERAEMVETHGVNGVWWELLEKEVNTRLRLFGWLIFIVCLAYVLTLLTLLDAVLRSIDGSGIMGQGRMQEPLVIWQNSIEEARRGSVVGNVGE